MHYEEKSEWVFGVFPLYRGGGGAGPCLIFFEKMDESIR
jgi:hypothetical protein